MATAPSEKPAVTPERIMQYTWGYAPPLILEAAVAHGGLQNEWRGVAPGVLHDPLGRHRGFLARGRGHCSSPPWGLGAVVEASCLGSSDPGEPRPPELRSARRGRRVEVMHPAPGASRVCGLPLWEGP